MSYRSSIVPSPRSGYPPASPFHASAHRASISATAPPLMSPHTTQQQQQHTFQQQQHTPASPALSSQDDQILAHSHRMSTIHFNNNNNTNNNTNNGTGLPSSHGHHGHHGSHHHGSHHSESIQVVVRVRPLQVSEQEGLNTECVTVDPHHKNINILNKTFTFDHVCPSPTTQADVFELVGPRLVQSCLSGYNGSILAYGQTGSGKTHTMNGSHPTSDERGLIPRILESLFQHMSLNAESSFSCKCSYVEIYNERVIDLLGKDHNPEQDLPIRLKNTGGRGALYVEGLSEHVIENVAHALKLLTFGQQRRTVGATKMNHQSSRSHSVFMLSVTAKNEQTGKVTISTLNLVDLAGSENQKTAATEGKRLQEGAKINLSLTNLSLVINALSKRTKNDDYQHVPFRNSKLTWLLRDSLGGNSKTTLIANISPSRFNLRETESTLKFAQSAKQVKNKAVLNVVPTSLAFLPAEIKQMIEEMQRTHRLEVEKYRHALQQIATSNGNPNAAAAVAPELFLYDSQSHPHGHHGHHHHGHGTHRLSTLSVSGHVSEQDVLSYMESFLESRTEMLEQLEHQHRAFTDFKEYATHEQEQQTAREIQQLKKEKEMQRQLATVQAEMEQLKLQQEMTPLVINTNLLPAHHTTTSTTLASPHSEKDVLLQDACMRLEERENVIKTLEAVLKAKDELALQLQARLRQLEEMNRSKQEAAQQQQQQAHAHLHDQAVTVTSSPAAAAATTSTTNTASLDDVQVEVDCEVDKSGVCPSNIPSAELDHLRSDLAQVDAELRKLSVVTSPVRALTSPARVQHSARASTATVTATAIATAAAMKRSSMVQAVEHSSALLTVLSPSKRTNNIITNITTNSSSSSSSTAAVSSSQLEANKLSAEYRARTMALISSIQSLMSPHKGQNKQTTSASHGTSHPQTHRPSQFSPLRAAPLATSSSLTGLSQRLPLSQVWTQPTTVSTSTQLKSPDKVVATPAAATFTSVITSPNKTPLTSSPGDREAQVIIHAAAANNNNGPQDENSVHHAPALITPVHQTQASALPAGTFSASMARRLSGLR